MLGLVNARLRERLVRLHHLGHQLLVEGNESSRLGLQRLKLLECVGDDSLGGRVARVDDRVDERLAVE